MKHYGLGTLSDFLGDFVVYRNLEPVDSRLPGPDVVRAALGLPDRLPRKTEPDYARIVVEMLTAARRLDAPEAFLHSLVFLGDTQLNDGTAYKNLCQAGGWRGLCFIGSENPAAAAAGAGTVERTTLGDDLHLYLANYWAALDQLEAFCAKVNIPMDEGLLVVVDLDKTALGARGRNATAIDQARVGAVKVTVADLLGDAFDDASFTQVYDTLNQVEYHPFTRDNQDYLAYISLILGSGMFALDELIAEIESETLANFETFIEAVDKRAGELPTGLQAIHSEILALVRAGDPTPFKAFRRNEYGETVRRMGVPGEASLQQRLAEEVLITAEVRDAALRLKERGALLYGLSDKPDEASVPTPELAAEGYQPIHRTPANVAGG